MNGTHNFFVKGNGRIYSRGSYITSDSRYKKDVKSVAGGSELSNLYRLRAVSFRYDYAAMIEQSNIFWSEERGKSYLSNDDETSTDTTICTNQYQPEEYAPTYGFIAQELRELYPELVDEDEDGSLSINYIALIPLLVEALKDQQQQIDEIRRIREKNSTRVDTKSAPSLEGIEDKTLEAAKESPTLQQNTPNPFTMDTQIGYYLPEVVKTATLYIYNMQGAQIKSYPLHARGQGEQTIFASELTPGMYLYTLIADGREVDTMRMILTK